MDGAADHPDSSKTSCSRFLDIGDQQSLLDESARIVQHERHSIFVQHPGRQLL